MVQQDERLSRAATRKRVCARWQLLYTLVNNPSLLGSRKHFQLQSSSSSSSSPKGALNGGLKRGAKEGGTAEASGQPVAGEAAEAEVSESPSELRAQ